MAAIVAPLAGLIVVPAGVAVVPARASVVTATASLGMLPQLLRLWSDKAAAAAARGQEVNPAAAAARASVERGRPDAKLNGDHRTASAWRSSHFCNSLTGTNLRRPTLTTFTPGSRCSCQVSRPTER